MATEPSSHPDWPATIINRRVLLRAVSAGVAAAVLERAPADEANTHKVDAPPDVSLAGQRRRGQALLRAAVAIGDRYYDESAGLIRVSSPRMVATRDIEVELLASSSETSPAGAGLWQLRLTDGMEVTAPVTPAARQQYENEHRPPVGALIAHPLFSLPSTTSARGWLHLED